MTPVERYQQDIESGHIVADPVQAKAIQALQTTYEALLLNHKKQQRLLTRLQHKFTKKTQPVKGVYLWGGVGIGKTYLMDLFFEALPFTEKKRMHFHHFMRMVQEQLTSLQGLSNPLDLIAKNLGKQIRVLCFDEFFVKDIADAMLLAGLLQALFQQGISLVATSNVEPDKLYRNGLQRGNFLPAIALIKQYTQVLHLDSEQDYRLRHLQQFGGYIQPLNEQAEQQLAEFYKHLAHGAQAEEGSISINQRMIDYRAMHADAIWFNFQVICQSPRSQLDYIEIANHFNVVIVSNVPAILSDQVNSLTYLINLVDVFYDSRVKLILSAAVPLEALYPKNGSMAFEFERTKSRLQEMQSTDYWHQ